MDWVLCTRAIPLAGGRGLLSRSVDSSGRTPWESWQNTVTKVGHAVNPQTPTKNTVSTTDTILWDQRKQACQLYTTSHIRKNNASISLASGEITSYGRFCRLSCTFTSLTMSPAELQKKNKPPMCTDDIQVCFYLFIHDHAMRAAVKFEKRALDISTRLCLVRNSCKE